MFYDYIYKIFTSTYFALNLHRILELVNVFIFFEFMISLILICVLLLTLLKKNYIHMYCLTSLNIILILLFLTFLFQSFLLHKSWHLGSVIITNDLESYAFLYEIIIDHFTKKSYKTAARSNFLYLYNFPFYHKSFSFNLFIYYIKNFTLFIFVFSLIIGYLQIKTIRVSFEKLLLILLPILFSNLILISTQDLIIAYLAIELQNLCLIFLISLKKKFSFNIQLSLRFFMLNSIGSLLILFGIVLLYSIFLTTNFSDIYIILSTSPMYLIEIYLFELLFALGVLILGLFFKLAVGPFGLWLVEIYEYSLTYGVLIFSLLPKIGYFIFLFHLYLSTSSLLFFWDFIFKFFGVLSIIIGTFGALSQVYLKRLLAFSSLNYFGYILLSFIGFTEKSITICILYFFIYVFISFYIWYIIMYLEKVVQRNVILIDLVILRDQYPMLATILSLSFFFLAGLPPFYLFILKFSTFYIFLSSYTNYFIILIFLICSFISIYYYLKLIKIIHFNPSSQKNYKMYRLTSFSIFMIISYSFFILSPYFFIIGKFIYTIFNKLIKNYLYNLLMPNLSDRFEFNRLVQNSVILLKHKVLGKEYNLILKNYNYYFKLLKTRRVFGINKKILNFRANLPINKEAYQFTVKYFFARVGFISWKFSQYLRINHNFMLKNLFINKSFEKSIIFSLFTKNIIPGLFVSSKTFFKKLMIQLYPFYKIYNLTKLDKRLTYSENKKEFIYTNMLYFLLHNTAVKHSKDPRYTKDPQFIFWYKRLKHKFFKPYTKILKKYIKF